MPGLLGASDWQIGPCGRGGLCPGSYTPLPTPTNTQTPNPNAPTPTPWPTPLATATPLSYAFQLRVDVGASQAGTDSQGQTWGPDLTYATGYTADGYGYLDSNPAYLASGTVDLTADSWLYLSFRQGPLLHYQVNVAPGQYQVTLLFAEFLETAPGQRVMNVVLQGMTQTPSVDIYATVQANRAYQLSYPITVSSGPLDIQVSAQTGQAVLSGFEVAGLQSQGTPTQTPTATDTPTPRSSPTPTPTPAPGQPITLQLNLPVGAQLLP